MVEFLQSLGFFCWAPPEILRHYNMQYKLLGTDSKDIATALHAQGGLHGVAMRLMEERLPSGRHARRVLVLEDGQRMGVHSIRRSQCSGPPVCSC